MTSGLDALSALIGQSATVVALVFLRVGAAVSSIPAFGEMLLSVRTRLTLAVAFAAVCAPAVAPQVLDAAGQATTPAATMAFILTEIAAGLAFGLTARLFVHALATAGAMIAQATSLAQLFGSGVAEPSAAVTQVLVLAALAVAVSAGLHVRCAEALIWTYTAFPPGDPLSAEPVADWYLGALARTFDLSFRLASPFMIVSAVYNLALGAINRAMPQLFITLVGAPATLLGALVLLFLFLPPAIALWASTLQLFLAAPDAALP